MTYFPDFALVVKGAVPKGAAGHTAPALTHADKICDFGILELATLRHFQILTGLAHRLNQKAFFWIAGRDRGAAFAAFQHRLTAIEPQPAQRGIRVTGITIGRQHGPDLDLEKIGSLRVSRNGHAEHR
jgi:hypothetical protein